MAEVPDTVDDALDGLSSPSTLDVELGTRAFSARELASSAARRAMEGGGGGGDVPFVGPDPPDDPTDGMLWFDTDDDTPADAGGLPTLVYASGSTSYGSDADLTFTAVPPGTAGNAIEVDYYNDGASQSLTVLVTNGNTPEVHLATDGGGASTSTASDVLAALQGDEGCSALVSVALADGSDGSGVIPTASFDFTALTGGTDGDVVALANTTVSSGDPTKPALTVTGPVADGDVLLVRSPTGDVLLGITQNLGALGYIALISIASLLAKSVGGSAFAAGTDVQVDQGDILSIDDNNDISRSGFDWTGRFWTNVLTAPADGDLSSGHRLFLWFDDTHGAAKLMVKALDADGDVVTGEVALA